ncbi:hypothetical protein CEQ28_023250 [Hafnia alvei]|nr:hypothetical protein CEQ28_023250 [Hafnia alvei]
MPDEVRAKLFKCLGYSLRIETDIEQERRAKLFAAGDSARFKIGVQRDIELLVRDVKKGEQPVTHEALESESPPDTAPSTVPDVTQAKPSNEVPLPPASPKNPPLKKTAAKKSAPKNNGHHAPRSPKNAPAHWAAWLAVSHCTLHFCHTIHRPTYLRTCYVELVSVAKVTPPPSPKTGRAGNQFAILAGDYAIGAA